MTDQTDNVFKTDINEKLRLLQLPGGLTFGSDAYLLAAYIKGNPRFRAVDLGSGTGVISMLCLTTGKCRVCHAVEIQPVFCDIIAGNAKENGLEGRLIPLHADLRDIGPNDIGGECDLVFSNPPYLPLGGGELNASSEKAAARHELNGGIFDFCKAAGSLLKSGGCFVCVFRADRTVDLLCAMRAAKLEPKRLTYVSATRFSKPSVILAEAVKDAAPSLCVTPGLALWEADPDYPAKPATPNRQTPEADYIYGGCSFPNEYRR